MKWVKPQDYEVGALTYDNKIKYCHPHQVYDNKSYHYHYCLLYYTLPSKEEIKELFLNLGFKDIKQILLETL